MFFNIIRIGKYDLLSGLLLAFAITSFVFKSLIGNELEVIIKASGTVTTVESPALAFFQTNQNRVDSGCPHCKSQLKSPPLSLWGYFDI